MEKNLVEKSWFVLKIQNNVDKSKTEMFYDFCGLIMTRFIAYVVTMTI